MGNGVEGRYERVIARLGEALRFGINPSLDGIRELTAALGNPQDRLRCVQVTGTNGKTSVSRMIAALLREHGFKVGLYTSPHLISYTERIEIDGVPVSEDLFASALEDVFAAAESLGPFTEFELLTAAALHLMAQQGVEWAVLEVGMGGRWDATSVVAPELAVITGVSLDHTDRLGTTREEIAADKAHIIKPGSRVVLGPGCDGVQDIFYRRAAEVGAETITCIGFDCAQTGVSLRSDWRVLRAPDHPGGMLEVEITGLRVYHASVQAPAFQAPNVATAVIANGAAVWGVSDPAAIERAFKSITFPGRFEIMSTDPMIVIDGAHNPEAAEVLASEIAAQCAPPGPVIVLGVLADKDVAGIVRALAPVAASFIATENGSPRCLKAADLGALIERVTGIAPKVEPDLAAAIKTAVGSSVGTVVTGSLYTAGAARALYRS